MASYLHINVQLSQCDPYVFPSSIPDLWRREGVRKTLTLSHWTFDYLAVDCGVKPEFLNINKSTKYLGTNICIYYSPNTIGGNSITVQQMACPDDPQMFAKRTNKWMNQGWTKYILLFWFVFGLKMQKVKYLFSGDISYSEPTMKEWEEEKWKSK